MAEPGTLEGEFSCAVCLKLLKHPVTSSCGHSYCLSCIKQQWDEEDERKIRSCPLCRKDNMITYSMEQLKLMGLSTGRYRIAALGDVACDICTGVKLKATKSSLQCLASYCDLHLHKESHAFHKLIKALVNIEEYMCSRHNEVMQMFCRTDDQCICSHCSVEEHKGHDTVSAAAERTERQKELGEHFISIQQTIQDRQKDLMLLQDEIDAIDRSAHKAVRDSHMIFSKLSQLVYKRRSDVRKWIRSQQETEASRTKELQDRFEQEITELRRRSTELEQIFRTEDDTLFLRRYHSLSQFSGYTDSPSINIRPPRYFEDVMLAMSEFREKLQAVICEEWTKISLTLTEMDVLLPRPEPETRNQFLKLSRQITLDPNTANKRLLLCEGNRKATWMSKEQSYSDHPQRFTECLQVLSRESLTGRCYWEVGWSRFVSVAVAYKNISRTGRESLFGENDKSWALDCLKNEFRHNSISTSLSANLTSKIGVYLDQGAGILSFYSVSETTTLLHRVRVTFKEPLHVGLCVCWESTAELCKSC